MLSNLVITPQKLVLIIDEIEQETTAQKFVGQLLREQGHDELTLRTLPLSSALKEKNTLDKFIKDCSVRDNKKRNVLLPALSDLLCYVSAAQIFQFIDRLKSCKTIERIFLWVTPANIIHSRPEYIIAACQYMADLVVHLRTENDLTLTVRKSGGGVTERHYTYKNEEGQIMVKIQGTPKVTPEKAITKKSEPASKTFKIELEEDELTARNALKLPYEKTSETDGDDCGEIMSAVDEYDDDEDMDDDLCV